jgi:hypothetical protein
MIMLLIRLAVIILPTGITCFIAGFMWGRSTAYKEIDQWRPPAIDEPDFADHGYRLTSLTSRGKTTEI